MRVTRIRLRGVTTHQDTDVELPPTGLVLLTGLNGAGKSTLLEALPAAVWGKTLRDAPVWNPDLGYTTPRAKHPTCSVEVTANGVAYTRTQTGTRGKLTWDGADRYESRKDAQEALHQAVGTFEHWRRSHVLSSHDAANFTGATDAERKRLVELLAGVERYDTALAAVKADVRVARAKVDSLQSEADRAEHMVSEREAALSRMTAEPPTPPSDPPQHDLERAHQRQHQLERAVASATTDLREARDAARVLDSKAQGHLAAARQAVQQYNLVMAGDCPTCNRPWDSGTDDAAEAKVQAAKAEHLQATALAERAHSEAVELEEELNDLRRQRQQADAHVAEVKHAQELHERERHHYKRALAAYERLDADRTEAARLLEDARQQLTTAKAGLEDAQLDLAHYEAAAQVLGLKGVRAQMLARTLTAIETAANAWLSLICHKDTRVKLTPTGTKADGGTKHEIALVIEGPGGGHGYKGASGGERRRVDVAIMFALAQVAEASQGCTGGTLWADEVADALDDAGLAAVARALQKIARTRCVVLITHSPGLIEHFPGAVRYDVEDGCVRRVR